MIKSLTTNVCWVALSLSSVLNKKFPCPIIRIFEQIEVLLNNADHSVDAQKFRTYNEFTKNPIGENG